MPTPKNEESPVFGALCHSAMRLRSVRLSTRLMKIAQLERRMRRPSRGAEHSGLIDHHVGDRVLAHAVPVAIREPAGADHRAGFVRGPESEHEAATQLVAMPREHARKLVHAGIAGGIVGRAFAVPAVLVAADQNEVLAGAPASSPIVICRSRQPFSTLVLQPDAHRPLRELIEQIAAGRRGKCRCRASSASRS